MTNEFGEAIEDGKNKMIVTYKFLKSIYREYNESIFEGNLPNKMKFFIRTESKEDDFDDCFAWTEFGTNGLAECIVFNQFDWDDFASESKESKDREDAQVNLQYEDEEQLRSTMIHEMIHVWEGIIGDNHDHGETFMTWCDHASRKTGLCDIL